MKADPTVTDSFPTKTSPNDDIETHVAAVRDLWPVREVPISSVEPGLLRRTLAGLRARANNALTRPYVRPMIDRQNDTNAALIRALETISRHLEAYDSTVDLYAATLGGQVATLDERLARLEERFSALETALGVTKDSASHDTNQ